jgi:hypothetical protein
VHGSPGDGKMREKRHAALAKTNVRPRPYWVSARFEGVFTRIFSISLQIGREQALIL